MLGGGPGLMQVKIGNEIFPHPTEREATNFHHIYIDIRCRPIWINNTEVFWDKILHLMCSLGCQTSWISEYNGSSIAQHSNKVVSKPIVWS